MIEVYNAVIVGKNEELYLASPGHKTVEYVTGKLTASDHAVGNMIKNISSRREYAESIGCAYEHIVAPDKHSVYREYFPVSDFESLGHQFIRRGAAISFPIDVLDYADGRTYRLTDTHWTWYGRIQIAALIASMSGRDAVEIDIIKNDLIKLVAPAAKRFCGDLGQKLDPKRDEEGENLEANWTNIQFSNEMVSGNDGKWELLYSNNAFAKGRLIIFGDSFLLQTLLCLSAFFREILFCRTRYMHREMVSNAKPDLIITENVERYLSHVHPDSNAPPFLLIPSLLQREANTSVEAATALATFLRGGSIAPSS